MKKAPMLFIDRRLAGKFWIQLLIIVGLFLCLLGFVAIVYTLSIDSNDSNVNKKTFQKAFVDLTNPETLHNYVYDTTEYFHSKSDNNDSRIKNTNKWPPLWAVFLAYIVGAIVFTGLLIATFTNAWRARADRFRRGAVSYKFKGHIVFLGYNNLIAGMIQKICEENDDHIKNIRIVVGVESNASVTCDMIKNRLYDKYRNRVVVLQADSCNMEDLERLRVPYADEVYIIGEHDDAYNLKCYRTIYELSLCKKNRIIRMPQCYVNLHSQTTLTLFRTYASASEIGIDFSKFHSFSFYDEWARTMIQNEWKSNEKQQDHFFIAGMTEMGIALAQKVALLCHNPNDKHTIITFIDDEVDKLSKQFIRQHQDFFDHCQFNIQTEKDDQIFCPTKRKKLLDIEFEFIEGSLFDDIVRASISRSTYNPQQKTTISLCYDDPHQNLTMSLNLPDIVYEGGRNTYVWVYQPTLGDIGKYMKNSRYKNVVTFGMLGEDIDIRNEENINKAKLINHYFCHQKDQSFNYSNQLLIEKEWEGVDIAERWSCIRHADFILFLARYGPIDDISKMEKINNLEGKRSDVDKHLFPIFKKKDQIDHKKYIEVLLQDIAPEDFSPYKY